MLDLYPSPQIIPFNLRRSLTQHLRFDSSSHQPALHGGASCRRGDPVLQGGKRLLWWDLTNKQTNKQANQPNQTNKRRLSDNRIPGVMTALAGGLPRMMRPSPHQNYPRGGYSLEGEAHASFQGVRKLKFGGSGQSSTGTLQSCKVDKLKLAVRGVLVHLKL